MPRRRLRIWRAVSLGETGVDQDDMLALVDAGAEADALVIELLSDDDFVHALADELVLLGGDLEDLVAAVGADLPGRTETRVVVGLSVSVGAGGPAPGRCRCCSRRRRAMSR